MTAGLEEKKRCFNFDMNITRINELYDLFLPGFTRMKKRYEREVKKNAEGKIRKENLKARYGRKILKVKTVLDPSSHVHLEFFVRDDALS